MAQLHNDSDGILGTHVTWDDVENELRLSLGTEARFGVNKKATNIGETKGYMSKMVLIEPDWSSPESSSSPKLPQKFALKISSSQPIINFSKSTKPDPLSEEKIKRLDELCKIFHNREVGTYRFLTKNQENIDFPILKNYGSRKFSKTNPLKAFLIFEYVENFKSLRRFENLEFEKILPIVKGVAKFSALAQITANCKKSDLEFAGNCELLQQLLTEFSDQKATSQLFRESFPKNMRHRVEELIEVYGFLWRPEQILRISKVSEFCGYLPQLVHGDLWQGNLLFSKPSMNILAIIDFQTISFGSPAQDLTRLFIACLSAKDRRENLDFLLEFYYKHFVEDLEEIPNTLNQLKMSYQLMFPTMSLRLLPGILRQSLAADVSLEKAIDIMEDVIEIHSRNLDEFRQFFD